MTPDEIEKDRAPERIWIDDKRTYSGTPFSAGVQYVRSDLFDAMAAERDAALAGAVRVKSLVWKKRDIDIHLAQNYGIIPFYGQGPAAYYLARGSDMIAHGDTVDDLKSTAQADHEARIRAAIEPAVPSVSAAAKVLLDLSDKVQVIRREASGKANGARFQALDDVRQMIAKEIDALQENRNGQLNLF